MNKKLLLILVIVLLVLAAAGGGVFWYMTQKDAHGGRKEQAEQEKKEEHKSYKYVSVDKIIVMLRPDESGAGKHYLSTDLVFKTPAEKEKSAKEQIPLLRSIAVRALSAYSFEKAASLSIDQITAGMNEAYAKAYEENPKDKPFTEVLIGKLIVE